MNFIETCQTVGKDLALVQGAGGNISVKEGEFRRIKASGCLLQDVSSDSGHVLYDDGAVAAYIASLPEQEWTPELEGEYIALTKQSRQEKAGMTSIETGFHSFLSDAVIHTHPLVVNALTCSNEGADVLRELFPNAIILPYYTVGVVLSREVYAAGARPGDGRPIFLMNHGLIVHADTLDAAYEQTQEICATIAREFENREFPLPGMLDGFVSTDVDALFANGLTDQVGHLFPDSAVYCKGFVIDQEHSDFVSLLPGGKIVVPSENVGAAENVHAMSYILLVSQHFGGPKYLPEREVEIINDMASEKYRKTQQNI